jgi:hypothetical protein
VICKHTPKKGVCQPQTPLFSLNKALLFLILSIFPAKIRNSPSPAPLAPGTISEQRKKALGKAFLLAQ